MVDRLAAWATQDNFVYEHDWRVGDLVVWDSIGTVHRRDAFDAHDRRYLRKMSILADADVDPWSPRQDLPDEVGSLA